jgi:hypothetical protein
MGIVIPFVLIMVTEFNENKLSRTRRLIKQSRAIGIESKDVIGYLDHLKMIT